MIGGNMSFEDTKREELISRAVNMILDDTPIPVDTLAELDSYGVNLNWLFTEAASVVTDNDDYLIMGALK